MWSMGGAGGEHWSLVITVRSHSDALCIDGVSLTLHGAPHRLNRTCKCTKIVQTVRNGSPNSTYARTDNWRNVYTGAEYNCFPNDVVYIYIYIYIYIFEIIIHVRAVGGGKECPRRRGPRAGARELAMHLDGVKLTTINKSGRIRHILGDH